MERFLKTALLGSVCLLPVKAEDWSPQASGVLSLSREIVDRTEQRFGKVVFYKPIEPEEKNVENVFAPLIVEEVSTESAENPCLVGTIDSSHSESRDRLPTVYFDVIEASSSKTGLREIVYWWRHEVVAETDLATSQLEYLGRGFRLVVGAEGMPVLWEGLGDAKSPRVFYAARSIEAAASRQFGKPMPGRHFSVERSVEEKPDIVVARILDDGPIPMGPYVYVDACPKNITTLLCRCMASQFEEAVKTLEYELVPIDRLQQERPAKGGQPNLNQISTLGFLDELLRWPNTEVPEPPAPNP